MEMLSKRIGTNNYFLAVNSALAQLNPNYKKFQEDYNSNDELVTTKATIDKGLINKLKGGEKGDFSSFIYKALNIIFTTSLTNNLVIVEDLQYTPNVLDI